MHSFTAIWVQDKKEVDRLIAEGWILKLVREGSHWINHLLIKEDEILKLEVGRMERKKQVCSLALSKELKALGVEQSSVLLWIGDEENKMFLGEASETLKITGSPFDGLEQEEYKYYYSAFTVAELGETLPKKISFSADKSKQLGYELLMLEYKFTTTNGFPHRGEVCCPITEYRCDVYYRPFSTYKKQEEMKLFIYWEQGITEADARAKMLKTLVKNKLLTTT